MLTGRRAFEGEDITDTIVSVLSKEPDFAALPAIVPARVTQALRVCLRKDAKQRAGDIRDVRLALDGAFETATAQTTPLAAVAPRSLVARALPWTLAGAFGVALITALALWAPWRSAPVQAPRTLLASIGADASLSIGSGASAILSPDGTTVAFVARQAGQAGQAGQTRLFLRRLDQLQADPLAGTEGATSPFFSPDGQWVAFFAGGTLKKVSVTGGAAVALCDAPGAGGGTWTDDDTILFAGTDGCCSASRRPEAHQRSSVPSAQAPPPSGGRRRCQAVRRCSSLRTCRRTTGTRPTSWSPRCRAGRRRWSSAAGTTAGTCRAAGSPQREREGGHLVYVRQGTLFAVRFDLTRLETVGPAVPALEGVAANPTASGARNWRCRRRARSCMCPARPRRPRVRSTG